MRKKDTFYYIYLSDALIKKNVRSGIGDVKLTPGVIKILDYLGHHENVIQKDISDHFREEPASITSALKYMESRGLVRREEHPKDNRAKSISLTEEGERVKETVAGLYRGIEEKGLGDFTQEEIRTLNAFLARICKNLEEPS